MASKKNIEENMDMANLSAKELSAMADALLASAEEDKPKKTMPKQYNEKEMRRFNRQVSSRNATDDDDDTI